MVQIVLAVAVFTGIVVLLSAVILLARSRLVETGAVEMIVNDDREFQVPAGAKLLTALSSVGLYFPGTMWAQPTSYRVIGRDFQTHFYQKLVRIPNMSLKLPYLYY